MSDPSTVFRSYHPMPRTCVSFGKVLSFNLESVCWNTKGFGINSISFEILGYLESPHLNLHVLRKWNFPRKTTHRVVLRIRSVRSQRYTMNCQWEFRRKKKEGRQYPIAGSMGRKVDSPTFSVDLYGFHVGKIYLSSHGSFLGYTLDQDFCLRAWLVLTQLEQWSSLKTPGGGCGYIRDELLPSCMGLY